MTSSNTDLPKQAAFVGFGPRLQFSIVLAGVLMGALAFWGSWSLAAKAQSRLGIEAQDGDLIKTMSGICNIRDEECISDFHVRMMLQFRALETYAHVKGISNKQSLGVLAIGAGMALMSIGFSLFLVGAEGAFRVKASTGGDRRDGVMLYGTAPGLLAFGLATVMVCVGANNSYELQFDAKMPAPKGNHQKLREMDDLCAQFRANPSAYSEIEQAEYEKACGMVGQATAPEPAQNDRENTNPECPTFLRDPNAYTEQEQQMYAEICSHPKDEIEAKQ